MIFVVIDFKSEYLSLLFLIVNMYTTRLPVE